MCGSAAMAGSLLCNAQPGQAFVRVDGYMTATVSNPITGNSAIAEGDRLRFDFTIRPVPSSTNSTTINQWSSANGNLISWFNITKCSSTDGSDPCITPSQVVTDHYQIALSNSGVAIRDINMNWEMNMPTHANFNLSVAAKDNTSGTGMKINIGNTDQIVRSVQFGVTYDQPNSIPMTFYDWYRIGDGTPARSDLAANNIIENVNTAFGYQEITGLNQTGRISWNPGGPGNFANLNVNSISFTAVPVPLPIFGSFAAFAYSRKLKNRIQLASK
jgi:hypothetical protein